MRLVLLTHVIDYTDHKFYINADEVSEILPREMCERRGDSDDWNTMVVMSNGNDWRVLEKFENVVHMIAQS